MNKEISDRFPSPLEVDRFLYILFLTFRLSWACFRPLSRWIGSYTSDLKDALVDGLKVSVPFRGR